MDYYCVSNTFLFMLSHPESNHPQDERRRIDFLSSQDWLKVEQRLLSYQARPKIFLLVICGLPPYTLHLFYKIWKNDASFTIHPIFIHSCRAKKRLSEQIKHSLGLCNKI